MTKVRFISADGEDVTEVEAAVGTRLLDLAQSHGQPLEGTCEGSMACSTCHVVVEPADYEKLPPPTEPEEDMLDFAAGVRRTSRLACQVYLTEGMETLTVRMPGEVHNMQGR
jgi:ferredoxin